MILVYNIIHNFFDLHKESLLLNLVLLTKLSIYNFKSFKSSKLIKIFERRKKFSKYTKLVLQ